MLRPNYSKSNDDLIVQLNDWTESDVAVDDDESSSSEDDYGNKKKKFFKERKYVIRAYGITEDGHSISVNITDFTPFFFIEVPKGWNRSMVKMLKNKIQSRVNKWSVNSLISFTIVKRIPFYGFCNNEQSFFIKLVFKNLSGFYSYKKAVNQTSENPIRIRDVDYDVSKLLYETKVTPLLRFFHSNDLKPVGWVKIPKGYYKHNFPKKTRCQIDCTVNYRNVQPVDLTKIGKFVVASFDIECTSGDGSFPDADKKDDKIIQIGTTVNIFGDDKIYKHIVTLKKCAEIEGAIVEEYENEKQLLIGWCNFLRRIDPDVLTGYNIWGFDWKYIYQRAGNGNGGQCAPYQETLLKKLSKANPDDRGKVGAKFVEKELQSSALGQNFLYYIQIDGIVQVDLYKLIQKDYNLVSYKLNSVCEHFMGQNKEDLTPNQLFRNFKRGTPEDIKEIATYCIQDNVLCTNLINKLKVIPKNVAMGNVCCIPFSYLFLRGQGIKIFSLVIKRCTEEGFLIKNLSPEDIDANSYEGAIVFIPEPGLYLEPVAVMDFASLYPSSMIAENISHDSIVGFLEYYLKPKKNKSDPDEYELKKDTIRKEYEGLPDYEYIDIKYDIYQGKLDEKKRVGYKICRYAERKDGKKAVLPRILMDLLKARRDTRSKIKYKHGVAKDGKEYVGLLKEKDGVYTFRKVEGTEEKVNKDDIVELRDEYSEFDKENLDGQQLAFKVTCNSLYGQVGATTSPICFKELAASTTATGRLMVTYARDYTLEKYQGSKLVYGDSVLGDEPILLKDVETGNIVIKTIETLGDEWIDYGNFKPFDPEDSRKEKEQAKCDKYLVWSNGGWTKIKKVIRHKTKKRIFRVVTKTGVVDVTEDHSLLDSQCNILKPKDVVVGETKLLKGYPDVVADKTLQFGTNPVEFISRGKLKTAQLVYKFKEVGYKVSIESIKNNEFHLKFYLSSEKDDGILKKCYEIGKIGEDKYVYDLETEEGNFQAGVGDIIVKNTDSVFINFADYIRKKYSSNYENNQIDDREMMRLTIEVGKEAGSYVTSKLKKPQDLEYEKVFWPFMIFSKKRYVGNKYEYSPDKFKQTSMGIVLKRRDNAPIVKDIYGGIIDFLLNKRNVPGAYDFFRMKVRQLLDGKIDINRLVISKSLKANYKNPTTIPHKMLADRMGERDPGNKPQSNDRVPYCFIDVCNLKCKKCNVKIDKKDCKCVKCMDLYCKRHIKDHGNMCRNLCRFCKMPERELADGTKSIKLCNICKGYYCKNCFQKHKLKENTKTGEITYDKCKKELSTKLIQGDIVEEPTYIKDNNLKIDYMYYLERQIENPVLQMFGLIRKDPENIIKDIKRKFMNKQSGRKSIESFFGSGKKRTSN